MNLGKLEKTELKKAIADAVYEAIDIVGIDSFLNLDMFHPNR